MGSKIFSFLIILNTMACYEVKSTGAMNHIVVYNADPNGILRKATTTITKDNWEAAKETALKLLAVREKIGGGAGLAAPQIGIAQPVFIYTPDRTTANLRVVINPSYEPLGSVKVTGKEACFSVPLHMTKLARWEKIKVRYQNLEGDSVEEVLEGFAAKVFQHEMDHLNATLTIDHPEAEIQTFPTQEAFEAYMQKVRLEDSKRY
jgi:peptide deformylase